MEPGLASEILKEANLISGSNEKYDSLPLALQRLGQKGVFQAVSACSTRKILQMRYNDFQKYWKFSRQCAFYAKELPSILNLNISVERLYLGGLFHNLGKLIIYSIQDEFSHSLVNTTLEEIEFGVSHTQIGSLVAERWGYSNQLVSLIKNYTRPLVIDQEIQLEACILHLADYMIRSEAKYDKFVYLDINSIFYLGIKNRQTILEIHQILLNKFNHFNSHSLA
jgi:HD-like signal output (HDOD) protein